MLTSPEDTLALNSAATLVINTGNYFKAPVGTEKPADLKAITEPWENIGHTSLEEIMAITSEGGETTVLGTLQNKQLRTSKSTQTDAFGITLQQFDEAALKLYYGSNATVGADGSVRVPDNPAPTVCAFLAVFVDADKVFSIYAPKVEISRGDDLDFADTESLAGLPLTIQPLNHEGNNWPYEVSPLGAAPGGGD